MKKIPTLFERRFEGHRVVEVLPNVTPGMEWVLEGEGDATIKIDGSCCAIIGGIFYRRYDAKAGKKPPAGGIPCCDPDPITGHWPHWVPVDPIDPADKWYAEAFRNSISLADGTMRVQVHRSFEGIREYLRNNPIEGIVFWRDGEPQCQIKRSDFGFEWPVEER